MTLNGYMYEIMQQCHACEEQSRCVCDGYQGERIDIRRKRAFALEGLWCNMRYRSPIKPRI
jgi:hypothetical protein